MKLKRSYLAKVFSIIRVTYPNAYPTKTEDEELMLVETWYEIFNKYPQEVFDRALHKAMETSEFAPKPATVMKAINDMKTAYEKDDNELWAELQSVLREVSKCVYRFGHTYVEADGVSQGDKARRRVAEIFDGLDPALKDYCRDQRGLVELARYTDEQTSYERGRFMRIMPTVRERIKTRHDTPENVRVLLQGITDKMTLRIEENAPQRRLQ